MANPLKIKCTVSSIINHNDTVSTITLKPSRRLPNFQPGQFLHLALDAYDPTGGGPDSWHLHNSKLFRSFTVFV